MLLLTIMHCSTPVNTFSGQRVGKHKLTGCSDWIISNEQTFLTILVQSPLPVILLPHIHYASVTVTMMGSLYCALHNYSKNPLMHLIFSVRMLKKKRQSVDSRSEVARVNKRRVVVHCATSKGLSLQSLPCSTQAS